MTYTIKIDGDEHRVGYPADILLQKLDEELETLRASNRIKQANIEQLKAENERLKTELLCLTHDRDALLAERDRYKLIVLNTMRQKAVGEVTEDNGVLGAVFYKDAEMQLGDTIYAKPASSLSLEAENAKLIAERDQWMKVVEEAFHDGFNSPNTYNDVVYNNAKEEWEKFKVDYQFPQLPAQQIPEGLRKWYVKLTNQDQVFDAIDADNINHVGYLCTNEMLNELESMLSASQQKGDV